MVQGIMVPRLRQYPNTTVGPILCCCRYATPMIKLWLKHPRLATVAIFSHLIMYARMQEVRVMVAGTTSLEG